MDKFQLIQALEGKLVPVRNGEYYLVKDGMIATDYGTALLLQYEVGELEIMYKYAKDVMYEEVKEFHP